AGLNFVGNTYFNAHVDGRDNITSFEFIPWVLSQCANIKEVKELLEHTNVVNTAFNSKLPPAQLHYMISDDTDSIVIECMKDGMHIYDNPTHVLTNNPPFKEQISRLND
ncbi:linear amide C-N hydrolase, partial [Erysipelatoclostridium ramosum]